VWSQRGQRLARKFLPHLFETILADAGSQRRRHFVGKQRTSFDRVLAALQLCEQRVVASHLRLGCHQVHHGVDQSPGQVAAQGGDQQRAHFLASIRGHTDGTDETHGHEQSEDDFGSAVYGIERGVGSLVHRGAHQLTPGMK